MCKHHEYTITTIENLPESIEKKVLLGHSADETAKGVVCNYREFSLVAKNNHGAIEGVLTAYTAYSEISVDDIWVDPEYRGKGLGSKLLSSLEDQFKGKGYNNINLVTSQFQAPDFYKKCGFEVEFVRINKHNSHLTKTFFIKYFTDENQHQGIIEKKPSEF